jgi:hypothetical protein
MIEIEKVPFINAQTQRLFATYQIKYVEDLDSKDAVQFFLDCCNDTSNPLAATEKVKFWNAIKLVKDFSDNKAALYTSTTDFVSELLKIPNITPATITFMIMAGVNDFAWFNITDLNFIPGKALEIVKTVQSMTDISPEETGILWADTLAILVYAFSYNWGWTTAGPGIPKYNPPG